MHKCNFGVYWDKIMTVKTLSFMDSSNLNYYNLDCLTFFAILLSYFTFKPKIWLSKQFSIRYNIQIQMN